MELKEGKMTLRDRKLLLNSRNEINKDLKQLPGFADGTGSISPITNYLNGYQSRYQNFATQAHNQYMQQFQPSITNGVNPVGITNTTPDSNQGPLASGSYNLQPVDVSTVEAPNLSSTLNLDNLPNPNIPIKGLPEINKTAVRAKYYAKQVGAAAGKVGMGVLSSLPQAIGFIGQTKDAATYDKGVSELNQEAGESQHSAYGIGFTQQNQADADAERKAVRKQNTRNTIGLIGSGAALGASIGSVVPVIGTGIGAAAGAVIGGVAGFLSGKHKKKSSERQINAQRAFAQNQGDFALSGAGTQAIQNDIAMKEGNYKGQSMYGAKNGKMPSFHNGKVHTSSGLIGGKQNSWGSAGETIINPETGEFHVMPGKPNFKDTMPMYVRGKDAVLSNHGASQYFQATHDLGGALAMDYMYRANDSNTYKNGKLPGCKEGMLGNIIPSSLGAMMSIGQLLDAKNQDIASPNIYASNPYEQSALNTLAGLRINEYPIINRLTQQRAESDYAIDNSGGLSGGQRARMRAANLATTQRNIADLLSNIQAQNNQYRSQFANAQMQLGTQQAQRRQQANQFRADMTARAHAARQQGIQMGWQNLLSQIQGFYANEFKRRQFNDTMDLYRQDQKLQRDRFNAQFPDYNKPKTNTATSNPTVTQMKYGNPTIIPQPMQDAFWYTKGINAPAIRQNMLDTHLAMRGFDAPLFRNAFLATQGFKPQYR